MPASPLRSIVSGSIGNLVGWYDWYVYLAFALYFAPVFFPKGSSTAQLPNTAAIFAVGFLMRPLGAALLGSYADRRGRWAALLLSVQLMAGGSLLIALVSGYATLGLGAPALRGVGGGAARPGDQYANLYITPNNLLRASFSPHT